MKTKETEKELIKIFTSSGIVSYSKSRRWLTFCMVWKIYHMWILPTQTPKTILVCKSGVGKLFELQEIPTKALAILAITCRPAYEFYRKHWVEK